MKRHAISIAILAAMVIGCLSDKSVVADNTDARPSDNIVESRRSLTANGGRVDWCAATNKIAFDRMTGPDTSEVFVINPDGNAERCITCNTPGLPKGIRGQPAWHPDGRFLVIQVQGKYYRGEGGFFESHALRDNMIWFSHTRGGRPLVDDIYRARWDGTGRFNITNSPGTWEEHGELSPNGHLITFNSSRGFDWKNPPDTARNLQLELWARQVKTRKDFMLTNFNKELKIRRRVLTSDYAWGPTGREIAVYYATFGGGTISQKIDILRLDREY